MSYIDKTTHSGVLTLGDLQAAIRQLKAQPDNAPFMPLLTDREVDYILSQGVIPEGVTVSPESAKKIKEAKAKL